MKQFITAIENVRSEIYLNSNIQNSFTSHGGYLLNTTVISSWNRIFSSNLDRTIFGFYLFQSVLFIFAIETSILLKAAF